MRNLIMPTIGRKQIEFDQFYTCTQAVQRCLKEVKPQNFDCVIEPSAGNGSFVNQINHPNIIALDINPTAKGILKCNFLEYELTDKYQNVLVIGNPPFGVRHNLSDAFLKKSFGIAGAQMVAFVLPNTYNKATRQKIIPAEWRIRSITSLERDSFIYNGEIRHAPCSFFVFENSNQGVDLRFNEALYKFSEDFEFASPNDFDFFVFGANPGKVRKKPTPNNRGYLIKSKIDPVKLAKNFSLLKWNGHSCANGGVAWFTKAEIIKHYNETYSNARKTSNQFADANEQDLNSSKTNVQLSLLPI